VTPLGAQALWRWLAAPALWIDVLAARERSLAQLAGQPALRDRIRETVAGQAAGDAAHLPRLLWEPPVVMASEVRTGSRSCRSTGSRPSPPPGDRTLVRHDAASPPAIPAAPPRPRDVR
jgi:hypothetical protein